MPRVKNDIIRLSQSGTQTVKFVDRTFNANAERANEILLFIKENYGKDYYLEFISGEKFDFSKKDTKSEKYLVRVSFGNLNIVQSMFVNLINE